MRLLIRILGFVPMALLAFSVPHFFPSLLKTNAIEFVLFLILFVICQAVNEGVTRALRDSR
jgi:hypothetical protein